MNRTNLQACHYERLSHIRQWQIHPGSNHFCCNGRCVTGRNLSGAILVISLISFTCLVWLIFELPVLIKELNSFLIIFVGAFLIFYTYAFFFRSMCMDPGILSRPSSMERSLLSHQLCLHRMTSDQLSHLSYTIPINEIRVQCKFCVTCQMIRPPRASHCATCSNCISLLDHHCPFLSTCIGLRNYRFFVFFLLSLLQTSLFFFTTSSIKIFILIKNQTWTESFQSCLSSYLILITTGSTAIYTCNLLGYHCMISSRALTTREDDKNFYREQNPFDQKSYFWNLAQRFCTSLPPSAYGAHRLVNAKEYRNIKENI